MASLELNHIYKVYQGGVKAVNDMTMKIDDKEFIVFVGPSGCGKSTTLRMIAGLEEISAGELKIGDQIVNDMTPKERNIAMVFQNYALYPHMTVYNNIAYGLKIAHMPKAEIDQKVHEAAKILGIEEYLDRKPKALSGGQRQRVALGRAIVRNPKVFLLDEPLSNLDAKLRGEMRAEISKLHKRLQTTFIYVTHDQTEAMTMGTRIVVMKAGFVQQIDTPRNVYNYPANKFVAGFIGTPQMNFYDGTLLKDGQMVHAKLDMGKTIDIPYRLIDRIPITYLDGVHRISLGIRPDNIAVHEDWMDTSEFSYLAKISAHLDLVEVLGGETILYGNIKTEKGDAPASETDVRIKTTKDVDIHSNEDADFVIDLRKIHVFDAETEQSLISKIPPFSTFNVAFKGGKAVLKKQSFALAPAVLANTQDGLGEVTVPSDAVKFGAGTLMAKVVSEEAVGQKKLFALDVDGNLIFATADPSLTLEKEVCIDFDQTKISLKENGKEVKPLPEKNILKGKIYKSKTYHTYVYSIEGKDVPVSQEKAQKLFSAKGKAILKTPLEFSCPLSEIDMNDKTFNGQVTASLDYGAEGKYAYVRLESGSDVIVKTDKKVGETIAFGLKMDKTAVIDGTINIILA